MLSQRRSRIQTGLVALLVVAVLSWPSTLAAQDERRSPFLVDLAKEVAFDPTTYAPTIIAYDAATRDWNSSQIFFQHGYLERNPKFTLSGLPNDVPLSYDAGRRVILKDAFVHLQVSAIHNATTRVLERMLSEQFPERRKLIRVLGWIERSVFASYLAYELSHRHYEQASTNKRVAVQFTLP
jgi:hypothetical protein